MKWIDSAAKCVTPASRRWIDGSKSTSVRRGREERAARKELQRRLEQRDVPGARGLARALVDLGVVEPDIEPLAALGAPRAAPVLRAAADLSSLRRNSRNIRAAGDRAA